MQPIVDEVIVADARRHRVAWFDPPFRPLRAQATQALGICFTAEGRTVLVTWNDEDWSLPGGTVEPGDQTRFCARVVLEPFVPEHVTTARRLVAPEEFRDAHFWGREATAGLILERGLAVDAERRRERRAHRYGFTTTIQP